VYLKIASGAAERWRADNGLAPALYAKRVPEMIFLMTPLSALLLGLIEGFTEFLPISSTGHLIIAEKLLSLHSSPFVTSFTIAIQIGAILAVFVLYGQKLLVSRILPLRIFAAFIPTAICGTILYGVVKNLFLGNSTITLAAMFLGGIVLLLFELFLLPQAHYPNSLDTITYRQAIGIGLIQSFAMVPGVSRSAASIIGGLSLGLPRKTAVEFSFLLAIPTMVAATSLDLVKSGAAFSRNDWFLLVVGAITAFFTALAAIRWFLRFLQCHTFIPFALYRILAAPVFWWFLL